MERKERRDRLTLNISYFRPSAARRNRDIIAKRRTSLENSAKSDGRYFYASGNYKGGQNSKVMTELMEKFHFANIYRRVSPKHGPCSKSVVLRVGIISDR